MRNTILLRCIKPTIATSMYEAYNGVPVRKGGDDGSYNGRWTTKWECCSLKSCTSFEILDDIGITRRLSRKRFEVINV